MMSSVFDFRIKTQLLSSIIAFTPSIAFISEYSFCNDIDCRITGADISNDGKKVVLLSHKSVIELSGFTNDDFFSGTIKELPLGHISQKEGICFKDGTTVFITDEYSRYTKGNLYSFRLKN